VQFQRFRTTCGYDPSSSAPQGKLAGDPAIARSPVPWCRLDDPGHQPRFVRKARGATGGVHRCV